MFTAPGAPESYKYNNIRTVQPTKTHFKNNTSGAIGIQNVTYIIHIRFRKNRTYISTILQEQTQTRAKDTNQASKQESNKEERLKVDLGSDNFLITWPVQYQSAILSYHFVRIRSKFQPC